MKYYKSYIERLEESRRTSGSILCLGIDPVGECLPEELTRTLSTRIISFYEEVLRIAKKRAAVPGAFKANIGFFHALDRPRAGDFSGSMALAALLELLAEEFPGVPVILDAKRGDIARSSTNYGKEAFESWLVDALTVSPYMGEDSVMSIAGEARRVGGLLYVLAATSNPGAKQFQGLKTEAGTALAAEVARAVVEWHRESDCCGAVVGATHPEELTALLEIFASARVPVLIPGVGSQGGSPESVIEALNEAGYPRSLARINVSSAITHPWKSAGAPPDWRTVVGEALEAYHRRMR